ncbi:MAG TPA: hypothetical protein IAD08_08560 [Candidatus Scatovivens faecipullorum]|nr:hypothetical protein [Candidatus Scatovivens faecipullorum]
MAFLEWLVKTVILFGVVLPIVVGVFWLLMTPLLWLLSFLWEHKGWVFAVIVVLVVLSWIF